MKLAGIVLAALIVFMSASYLALTNWYNDNLQAVDTSEEATELVVVIQSGASVKEIGEQLHNLGLIRNATVFHWYVARNDQFDGLQAGTYRISSDQNVEQIVEQITSGDVATNLYTILPGQRLDELEDDFVEFGFNDVEVARALNTRYDHPLLADLPMNATLEGYIYPETHKINQDSDVEELINRSFTVFYDQLTPEIMKKLKKTDLSLHEAVILSSIIYLEGGSPEDQAKISQVFHKRLKEGITLGSDPTFRYAAAVTGQEVAVDIDSPYNTRIYGGLPPGPISNFNFSAFEAVVNPANTDYLYFVAGDDGKVYFSKTLEEHQNNVNKHCVELCQIL